MAPSTPPPPYTAELDELIHEVAQQASYPTDDERALSHLRSVFRVVRNRTSFDQSLRFLEMLPVSLKAIFLNDWHVVPQRPSSIRSLDDFADEVQQYERQHTIRNRDEARQVVRAVFTVLRHHTTFDALLNGLSFISSDVRTQLLQEAPARYHYADTCIWLS